MGDESLWTHRFSHFSWGREVAENSAGRRASFRWVTGGEERITGIFLMSFSMNMVVGGGLGRKGRGRGRGWERM